MLNLLGQEGVGDYKACDPRIDTKGVTMADSDVSVFYIQPFPLCYISILFIVHRDVLRNHVKTSDQVAAASAKSWQRRDVLACADAISSLPLTNPVA